MCAACCQLLPLLFLLALFTSVFFKNVCTLLVYDFQSLLNIRATEVEQFRLAQGREDFHIPPVFETVPLFLRCDPQCHPTRKKCQRRRGQQGSVLVKFKNCMAASPTANPYALLNKFAHEVVHLRAIPGIGAPIGIGQQPCIS